MLTNRIIDIRREGREAYTTRAYPKVSLKEYMRSGIRDRHTWKYSAGLHAGKINFPIF